MVGAADAGGAEPDVYAEADHGFCLILVADLPFYYPP